jgi:hypothetical protein
MDELRRLGGRRRLAITTAVRPPRPELTSCSLEIISIISIK